MSVKENLLDHVLKFMWPFAAGFIACVIFVTAVTGCVTNPETGKKEINWRWIQAFGDTTADNAHKAPGLLAYVLYGAGALIGTIGGGMATIKAGQKLKNSERGNFLGPTNKQLLKGKNKK